MTTILEAALQYAGRGWHVFAAPVDCSKKGIYSQTYAPRGFEANAERWGCTRDPERIEAMWREHPRANVGVACTESGVWDLETDIKPDCDGEANLQYAIGVCGPLPETLMARSPSGSLHRIFRSPGIKVPKRPRKFYLPNGMHLDRIDVVGDGGMFIAAPSKRSDGVYAWLNDLPVADAPQWLIYIVCGDLPSDRPRSARPKKVGVHLFETVPAFVHNEGEGVSTDPDDLPVRPDDDEVLFALSRIDPHELAYDDWGLGIVGALYSHFGHAGQEHFEVWSDWSDERYGRKGIPPDVQWQNAANARNTFTVATIFHLANEHYPHWRDLYRAWKKSK